jgi:hypothetical protein
LYKNLKRFFPGKFKMHARYEEEEWHLVHVEKLYEIKIGLGRLKPHIQMAHHNSYHAQGFGYVDILFSSQKRLTRNYE